MSVKTPLTYYGGKQRIAPQIVDLLPSNPAYVEAFAGGLAVLFARPRAEREIVNDLDGTIAAFWRAVRDHADDLAEAVGSTPYCREEWVRARAEPVGSDDVETARRLVLAVDQSFARSRTSWSMPDLLQDYRGRWQPGSWAKMPPRILAAARRLHGVAVENCDAVDLIGRSDRAGVTIYADPPYPLSTRSQGGAKYDHDDDGDLWPRLVPALLSIEHAAIVLSSYPAADTDPLEGAGWTRQAIVTRGGVGHHVAGDPPEAVWLSPVAAERSHQADLFGEAA